MQRGRLGENPAEWCPPVASDPEPLQRLPDDDSLAGVGDRKHRVADPTAEDGDLRPVQHNPVLAEQRKAVLLRKQGGRLYAVSHVRSAPG